VVASFKEAILSGIIQPGESIVESKVAQQLKAGIPLVREALIELEHQGYVQKIPYKGTTVTKLPRVRFVSLQRRTTRKDRGSDAKSERDEITRVDEKFGLGLETEVFNAVLPPESE